MIDTPAEAAVVNTMQARTDKTTISLFMKPSFFPVVFTRYTKEEELRSQRLCHKVIGMR
jgi:hypothetical protein